MPGGTVARGPLVAFKLYLVHGDPDIAGAITLIYDHHKQHG